MAAAPKLYTQPAAMPRARRPHAVRPRLGRRILAIIAVGTLVVAYLSTQVRLAVLQAEARQLRRTLADVEADNAMLLRQIRAECAPARIAKAADAMALKPPTGVDVIHPASLAEPDGAGSPDGSPEHLRLLAHELGSRLAMIFGGPAEASEGPPPGR